MVSFPRHNIVAGLWLLAGVATSTASAVVPVSLASAANINAPELAEALPSGDSQEFRERMKWEGQPAAQSSLIESIQDSPPKRVRVSSQFGLRADPLKGGRRQHAGIDFPGRTGTNVYATGAGKVAVAGWSAGYGKLVEIAHAGGLQTRYGHLSSINVAPGASVAAGQLIGKVGSTGRSTGPHLHYEVRIDGVATDPTPFLAEGRTEYRVEWAPQLNAEPRWKGWGHGADTGLPQSVIQ